MPLPIPRRRSKIEIPIHFVWATSNRLPMLTPEIEQYAHRVIQNKAQQLEATVLALNGMPDHIHLAVLFSPNVSIASFMQQIKRSSTIAIRTTFPNASFGWEPGYAAFGFPYARRELVITYIQNQKTHHENGKAIAYWEETGELKPREHHKQK